MGLFDNIFLDENSPTAMLDPLIEKKNSTQGDMTKGITEPSEASKAEIVMPEVAIDAVSFDDIQPQVDTTTEKTIGFLGGGDPTIQISDDMNFDIGGLDIASFSDEQASTVDSSDTPIVSSVSDLSESANIVIESTDENQETSETSIALVQGATAVSSDSIMDNTLKISIESTTPSESSVSMVTGNDTSNDVIAPITLSEVSQGDSGDGIMGLFSMDSAPLTDEVIPPVLIEQVTEASTELPMIDSQEINAISDMSPSFDQGLGMSFSTTEDESPVSGSLSTDSTSIMDRFTNSRSTQIDSPLQEMLMEFVAKLEKFNAESNTLDTEMTSSGEALIREEQDLKHEYEVRMNAIEYKRKHMEETRSARQIEKTRLERIIANLKVEIA